MICRAKTKHLKYIISTPLFPKQRKWGSESLCGMVGGLITLQSESCSKKKIVLAYY